MKLSQPENGLKAYCQFKRKKLLPGLSFIAMQCLRTGSYIPTGPKGKQERHYQFIALAPNLRTKEPIRDAFYALRRPAIGVRGLSQTRYG